MKPPKKTARSIKQVAPPPQSKPARLFKLSPLKQDLAVIALFLVVIVILFAPIVMNRHLYDGGDSQEAIVKTHQITKYYQETGEAARWNPYPEAGIPNVFFLPKPLFSIDFLLGAIGDVIGISIVYLLIGAIGMYFLLKYLRFSLLISLIISLAFILAPYYKSLIIVGQFMPTKFEAVMIIPWILLGFLAYMDKGKLLYLCLLSLALAAQLYTQHYQVIFYTGLLVIAAAIYPLWQLLAAKAYSVFFKKTISLLLAGLFALVLVAYPLLVSKKFNEASLRAKWGLDITKPPPSTEKREGGVAVDFVAEWSPKPRELMDFLIPTASGGTSQEKYTGSEIHELVDATIPAYWGHLTFSFSYFYFGLLVLIAIVGIIFSRHYIVVSFGILGLLFTLWGLGTSFKGFYLFFYENFPFIKNFRTPPTTFTVVYFILSILAAYGLRYFFEPVDAAETGRKKKIWIILGGFFALGGLIYLIGDSFTYQKANESYDPNYVSLLVRARKELFMKDLARYFLLVGLFAGIVVAYMQKFLKRTPALILVGLILIIDFALVNSRYTNALLAQDEVYPRYFPTPKMQAFINGDKGHYRVFPLTARTHNLSSQVPVIGDHDLQVLTTVFEIDKNNLYRNIDSITNINWNVLKIYAVKYFVVDREVIHPQLSLRYSDPASLDYVYEFNNFLPYGHFVKNDTVIANAYDRLTTINNASAFDPAVTAMLEKPLGIHLLPPDSSFSKLTRMIPHEMEFDLYTDRPALFVLSVPYVEEGWAFFLGEKALEVYPANHAMQAVVIPAGNHKLTARFNSSLYNSSYMISAIATILLYLALLWFGWQEWKKRKAGVAVN